MDAYKVDFSALELLANAESKELVESLFDECCRLDYEILSKGEKITSETLKVLADKLNTDNDKASKLVASVQALIKAYISETEQNFVSIIPQTFSDKLVKLIIRLLRDRKDKYRGYFEKNFLSASQLVDFDWRVDLQVASNEKRRQKIPQLLLNLKVGSSGENEQVVSSKPVQISHDKLKEMLSMFENISTQLQALGGN